jgi:hypothetical protein
VTARLVAGRLAAVPPDPLRRSRRTTFRRISATTTMPKSSGPVTGVDAEILGLEIEGSPVWPEPGGMDAANRSPAGYGGAPSMGLDFSRRQGEGVEDVNDLPDPSPCVCDPPAEPPPASPARRSPQGEQLLIAWPRFPSAAER